MQQIINNVNTFHKTKSANISTYTASFIQNHFYAITTFQGNATSSVA